MSREYIYSSLEEFIQKMYAKIKITSPYELQLYPIATAFNLHVYRHRHGTQALHFDGQQYVFLNDQLTPQQQWEAFGHELGHLFMHTGNQQNIDPNFVAYQEWQANLFAMHFCVPTFLLIDMQLPNDYRYAAAIVADQFNVTPHFAFKRLEIHKQKLIDQQFHTYLWSC